MLLVHGAWWWNSILNLGVHHTPCTIQHSTEQELRTVFTSIYRYLHVPIDHCQSNVIASPDLRADSGPGSVNPVFSQRVQPVRPDDLEVIKAKPLHYH